MDGVNHSSFVHSDCPSVLYSFLFILFILGWGEVQYLKSDVTLVAAVTADPVYVHGMSQTDETLRTITVG